MEGVSMNKINWKNVILILMPILSVGLATTLDSVTVYDSLAGTAEYYSYFELIPNSDFAIAMPLAAILSLVCGVLAAILIVKKNRKMLKGIVGCSFCAATLAVLPIMLHGDVVIVPNVGLPIFMMVDCFLAYMMLKKPQFEEESRHQRLTR